MSSPEQSEGMLITRTPDGRELWQADVPLYSLIIDSLEQLVDGKFKIVTMPTQQDRVAIDFIKSDNTGAQTEHLGADLFTSFLTTFKGLRDGLRKQGHPDNAVMQVVSSHVRTAAEAMKPATERLKIM